VWEHRLIFSNFPKNGNLKKMLVGGSFPLTPSAPKIKNYPAGIFDFFAHFSARISPVTG